MDECMPRFDFYEVVQVISEEAKLNGQAGTILGRTQTDDGKSWSYSVCLDSTRTCSTFSEDGLMATGLKKKKEDFYNGPSIRVIVDEQGRGRTAPQQ
jgi:hypothetical protein